MDAYHARVNEARVGPLWDVAQVAGVVQGLHRLDACRELSVRAGRMCVLRTMPSCCFGIDSMRHCVGHFTQSDATRPGP